jgi:hypothetical protein
VIYVSEIKRTALIQVSIVKKLPIHELKAQITTQ